MKIKKRDVVFEVCCDGGDLTQFIEDNSDLEWNDICGLKKEVQLYGDEGRCIGYLEYVDIEEYSKTIDVGGEPYPSENLIFMQDMINKFYEAYGLDKSKQLIILFTD